MRCCANALAGVLSPHQEGTCPGYWSGCCVRAAFHFADGYHCSTKFNTLRHREVKLSIIGALYKSLSKLGMIISHPKSQAIPACKGAASIKGDSSDEQRRAKFSGLCMLKKSSTSPWWKSLLN